MIVVDVEQGSQEWLDLHCGVLSASRMAKLLTKKKGEPSKQADTLVSELAAEWMIGSLNDTSDFVDSPWMKRGRAMEQQAANWYAFQKDVEPERIGFAFLDERRNIGCSPDFLIGDDGGLECKCPAAKTHVHYLRYPDTLVEDYRHQVQACMWICERPWWDLLSYNPVMRPLVKRVERDDEYIATLSAACEDVMRKVDEILVAEGFRQGD